MKRHCKSWDLLEGKMCFIVPHRDPVWYDFSLCVSFVQMYNRKFGGKYEPHLCLHIWKKPELKKKWKCLPSAFYGSGVLDGGESLLFLSSLRTKRKIHIWHLGCCTQKGTCMHLWMLSSVATKIKKISEKLPVFACAGDWSHISRVILLLLKQGCLRVFNSQGDVLNS